MKRAILLLLLFAPLLSLGQDEDFLGVNQAINNYFEGYVNRDIDKLKAGFHIEAGAMKRVMYSDEGKQSIMIYPFDELIPAWAKGKPRSQDVIANSILEVLSIDITDKQIASAKIKMIVGDKGYTDVLSLHKINGVWKITDKMFTTFDVD